ncbi:MAG TPA: TCP-1/cpn60 chaperonin family protein, partial [Candidatus Woesebacteria bacterium]|nr:TCP-1/cpn60 chaperonin family protein [Candidatus Woesebacteria bacterium]
AGGATTYLQARKTLQVLKKKMKFDEEKVGVEIVYQALGEPLRMLAQNSGMEPGVVLYQIEQQNDPDYGFDAVNRDFGSMFKKGIVDPAKVIRTAVQNAESIAAAILTTEALVADLPEKKEDPMPGAGGGMPGMRGMGGMY